MLDSINKLNDLFKVLPYIFLAIILWLFIMSVIVFLLYFNVVDIHSIVEAMKQCVVSI